MSKKFVANIVEDSNGNYGLEFTHNNQDLFNEFCRNRKGKWGPVRVTVTGLTEAKSRSLEQNAYYRGVVIRIIAEDLGYIGPMEREELHQELASMFLVKIGRQGKPYVVSTTDLDTATFEKYLKAVRGWALSFHNIKVPLPNEVDESDGNEFTNI